MDVDQTEIIDEKESSFMDEIKALRPPAWVVIIILFLVALCLLLFAALYWQNQPRPLKPARETATPHEVIVDGQPIVVTFEELNSNASAYQNKWVQVSGSYFPKSPTVCNPKPSNGPIFKSVLVAEGFQLDVQGGEEALAIVAVNTDMVVQGIWRRYSGPVGCGKEPASGIVWYLDIRAVVQPNPIAGSTPLPIDGTVAADILTAVPQMTPTPNADGSIPTPTFTPIPVTVVVETPIVTNTPTPTSGTIIPTPTTLVVQTPTATATDGTFTRTPTPNPNATATPQGSVTSTATATATVTGTPPTAVATETRPSGIPTATRPAGYPVNTPVPSSTPGGYP